MKHKPGQPCECEQCQGVHKLWHDFAALEDSERLQLTDGNGDPGIAAERTKAVILARGRVVSPYFSERLLMHGGAISAEEEARQLMGTLDPANADPDLEIREIRTGTDEIKRFEVSVKRPELADKSDEEQS